MSFRVFPHLRAAKSIGSAAAIGLIGLLLSGLAYRTANEAEEQRIHRVFDLRAEWRAKDMAAKLWDAEDALTATAVYVGSTPALTLEGFRRFVAGTNSAHRPVAALDWVPRVTREQRTAFEAEARHAGLDNFQITERRPDGTLVRASDRTEFLPIMMQGRFDASRPAAGFDIGSNPASAEVLIRSRDMGEALATPPAPQSPELTYGAFWPIYEGGEVPPTVSERRERLRGFVVGVFRTLTVLNAAMVDTPTSIPTIAFFAGGRNGEPEGDTHPVAIYSPGLGKVVAGSTVVPAVAVAYHTIRSFQVMGVPWRLEFSFSPDAAAEERSLGPISIFIAGLLLTAIVMAIVAQLRRQLGEAQDVVNDRTQELGRTTTRLQALIDSAPFAITFVDAEERFQVWNRKAEQMFGYTADEVMGRPFFLIDPASREEADRQGERLAKGETVRGFECRLRRKDASLVLTRIAAAPVFNADGTRLGVSSVYEDITVEKAREEALRQSRMLLAAIISSSEDAIISHTLNGIVTTWNEAATAVFGYTADEMIGQPISTFAVPGRESDLSDVLASIERGERVERYETQRRRKDGQVVDISLTVSAIQDAEGRIIGASKTARDITATKLIEQKQSRLEEQLHQSQKMDALGSLTGGVAHDFNNLLTVIKAGAEDMLAGLEQDSDLRDLAEMNLEAADRGAELVQQLLSFARKQELAPQVVDLSTMFGQFARLLNRTLEEDIRVEVKPLTEPLAVIVDQRRLENALLNLALNARDAMPGGGKLTIEAARAVLDEDYAAENLEVKAGRYVMICLSDTGGGMTKEVADRAFDPFFTTKDVGKGTGLGLSMVYGFIKQSGGHAKIYSELGKGTCIKIYLPPATEIATAEERRAPSVPLRGDGRVLLVEDNDLVRKSVQSKLIRIGYAVTTANNASEALTILDETPDFDLVFSDVVMPGGMNGAELAIEVKRRWPQTPVLLTSGYTELTALGKVQVPPGVRLLSKPYSNAELVEVLREILQIQ